MSNSTPPFADLVAVAGRFREDAIGIYRCDACAAQRGRWDKAELSRHTRRKGELLAEIDQAASVALRAAHRAGVSLDAAEQRIGGLVRACHDWMTWAWPRRGKGAWTNQQDGESEEDWLERATESALHPANQAIEADLDARTAAFRDCSAACVRMGLLSGPAQDRTALHQSYLAARDIAESYHIPYDALRKRLERFRRDSDRGWKTVEDRASRTEKYIYGVSAVWEIIDDLRRE